MLLKQITSRWTPRFYGVEHWFAQVGCATRKPLFLAVLKNKRFSIVALRTHGIFALDFLGSGDGTVTFVEQRTNNPTQPTANQKGSTELQAQDPKHQVEERKLKNENDRNDDQLSNLDHGTTNATSSYCEVQLYMFLRQRNWDQDDHYRKSPLLRHVSRTQSRVELVVGQNHFGPQNSIKCFDTKNQLVDLLTKGSFKGVLSGVIFSVSETS